MTLAELRKQYPQYDDMPDRLLLERLHRKYYSDMPVEEFARRIGYVRPPSPIKALDWWSKEGFGLAVVCALLLHVGIVSLLVRLGHVPPGTHPSLGPMAVPDVFPLFLTVPPVEQNAALETSPSGNLRAVLRVATPAPPVPLAKPVTARPRTERDRPARHAAVDAPRDETRTASDPTETQRSTAAVADAVGIASPETPPQPKRMLGFLSVPTLTPPRHLVPSALLLPLPQSRETSLARSDNLPPPFTVVLDSLPVVAPAGVFVAAPPREVGPAAFPPPGTFMAAVPSRTPRGRREGLRAGMRVAHPEGPRMKVGKREILTISAKPVDGLAVRPALYVTGTGGEVVVGLNHLPLVRTDWGATETEDVLSVVSVPPPAPNGIVITNPQDGHVLAPDVPPVILAQGLVADRNERTVWLIANGHRTPVRVRDGRFRKALPVVEPVLHLWAELPHGNGPPHRSRSVTVRMASPRPSVGIILIDWPRGTIGNQVKVSATWRPRPERVDSPSQRMSLQVFGTPPNGSPPEVFYLTGLKPGVYTIVLHTRGVWATPLRPTLYLPKAGHLTDRALAPIMPKGTGKVVLARILYPQNVLWEQDEWFTGQSESAHTVTKFRFPEGISWTERKGDLP